MRFSCVISFPSFMACLQLDLFNVHNVAHAISVYLRLVPDRLFKVERGLVNAKPQLIIFKRKIGS